MDGMFVLFNGCGARNGAGRMDPSVRGEVSMETLFLHSFTPQIFWPKRESYRYVLECNMIP